MDREKSSVAAWPDRLWAAFTAHQTQMARGKRFTVKALAEEASARLGRTVHASTASLWLSGKQQPTAEEYYVIGQILEVRPAWLAFADGEAADPKSSTGSIMDRVGVDPYIPVEHPDLKKKGRAG